MQLTLFFRRRLSILIAWLKIEAIETMNATADPSANFRLVIIQTELERFKFLVRSLLRARMAKVHSLTSGLLISLTEWRSPRSTPIHTQASPTALSHLESQYLHHHQHLLSSHYNTAFLSSFPTGLRKLDDTAGGISMIDQPDEDNAVFCRILRDAGQVEVQGEQGAGIVELNRGDIWVLRWRDVKEAVERGDIELI
jgi:GINS complex subunit 4